MKIKKFLFIDRVFYGFKLSIAQKCEIMRMVSRHNRLSFSVGHSTCSLDLSV